MPSWTPSEAASATLGDLVAARFEHSIRIPEAFFADQAQQIAEACWAMARRFHQGGRLLAFGNGASATDAQHIAVEFVHPVIVGKRALPALALTNDSATLSGGLANHAGGAPFSRLIETLARPHDIAIGFSRDGRCANVLEALKAGSRAGMLTLGLVGGDGGPIAHAQLDFCFAVPSDDAMVIQEVHETLYHVLWELVHIFFEHEGMLS